MNSKKEIALNMFASLLVFAMNLGINFFLTPYITEKIGTEAYGFVSLANNFVNYATILTIALNSMASRFITIAIHKGEQKKANIYFTSVFYANIFIILILVIPSVILIAYLEYVLKIPEYLIFDVKVLFSLIFFNFFVSIIDSTFSISTFATNKLHLHSLRNMEGSLIKVGCLLIAFTIFKPCVFYLGIATLISSVFLLITDIFYTKKLIPFVKVKRIYYSFEKVKELIKAGIWNTVTKLGQLLTDGLDLIICNLLIDSTAMGQLAISKTLAGVIVSLLSTVSGVFQPQLTISYAKNEKKVLVNQLKTAMKTTGIFINVPFCFIMIFGQAFFMLWLPNENSQLLSILTILSIQSIIISGVITPMYSIYVITNKIKADAIIRILIGAISTIIVFLLVKYTRLGIYAVAGVSTFLSIIVNLIFVPIYTAKYCLEIKWYTFYATIFKYIFTTGIMLVIFGTVNLLFKVNSWTMLIIIGFITVIIGELINYVFLLNKNDRVFIINFIKEKMEKKI